MPSLDPSQVLAPHDKLSVFVSSTIGECADERKFAVKGIHATNHNPILFEQLGARPYQPRDVYLSRLRQSHVMVAIYRDNYGYIDEAKGMSISGLEDEYRFARTQGLPILFFVRKESGSRDPRLALLINEIMSSNETVAFYSDPSELEELVKDSVTATITQRFFDAGRLEDALSRERETEVGLTAPPGGLIGRPEILDQLETLAQANDIVRVAGDAGCGKTVLLSQLSQKRGHPIVFASDLSPKELFGVLANKLRNPQMGEPRQFATYEGARLAFASAWTESASIRLLVDDSPHIDAVIATLAELHKAQTPGEKTLVYTTRVSLMPAREGEAILLVPKLSSLEIETILRRAGISLASQAIEKLVSETQGNPLALRQRLIASGRSTLNIWNSLHGSIREMITYLAIAEGPLGVEDLLGLREDSSYTSDDLFAEIEAIPELVVGTGVGFRIVHDSLRDELWQIINERPERLQFSAKRLGRYLARDGRIVRAYHVLRRAEHEDAWRLIDRASFEAARSGDWKASVSIAQDRLKRANERLDNEQIVMSRIALAQAYAMTGDVIAARGEIAEAQCASEKSHDELKLFVEGFALTFDVQLSLTPESLERLRSFRERLLMGGRRWQAAKVSIDLSVAYLGIHSASSAEEEARSALTTFEEVGDEYGIYVARRNLGSALVAQSGKEAEADNLIRLIEAEAVESDGRRSRAWLCNVLVRRNRASGRYQKAEEFAREAISIGVALGDELLVAINSVGLGNALHDQLRIEEALAAYSAAALSAQKCGRHDVEAHASYLTADTYNDLPDGHALASDAPARAEHFARCAIGLMKGTIAKNHLSRGYEAFGDALFSQGRITEAVDAYFAAASCRFQLKDWDAFERLFMTACHNTPEGQLECYLKGLGQSFGSVRPIPANATAVETLFNVLPQAFCQLPSNVIIPFFGFHLKRMAKNLPPAVQRRVVDMVIGLLEDVARQHPDEQWRFLYPAIVLAAGAAPVFTAFDYMRMAQVVNAVCVGITATAERDGGAIWLVQLALPSPVAISIAPMDAQKPTILACQLLAMFLKGFEGDLARELFGGVELATELTIMVGDASRLQDDGFRSEVETALVSCPCVVSRPTEVLAVDPSVPTAVFLADRFVSELVVGEGRGGALQALVGLTIIEVAYRLLRGSVELSTLEPKIVSLVRQSVS